VKRLAGQLSEEADRAMHEEARLLASVRHANVVSLLGMGREPTGAPFLILELVLGADLRALTRALSDGGRGNPVPDRVSVHIACSVLRALGAVQRAVPGLVHRDVTPHNVLISREGEVKLTDFGIALALDRARWTRPTIVKGKFGYMAPEQIRGEPLDARTDLFAVGVVLFELLAGRRPWFAAAGTMDELRAIDRGEIASILECRPRLDRALAVGVDRLLALDKRDRFPDCDAALRAIGPFGAGELGSLRLASIMTSAVPHVRMITPTPHTQRPATQSAPRLPSDRGSRPGVAQARDRSSGVDRAAGTTFAADAPSERSGVADDEAPPSDLASGELTVIDGGPSPLRRLRPGRG
jgi:serine/threonine-protein kinase